MNAAININVVTQNVVEALSLGATYALLALGIALVFGAMRLLNFAHGELIMIGGFLLTAIAGMPWPLLVVGTALVTGFAAVLTERIVFRPLRGAEPSTLLVASFALSFGLQSLATMAFGSDPRATSVLPGLSGSLSLGSVEIAKLSVVTVIAVLLFLVGLSMFLTRATLGVQMRAAAEDFDMVRMLGVRANRVIAGAFAISGVCAGVSAVLLVSQTGIVYPTMGVTAVLIAFVATILGGMGSLPGAVLGGFLVGALTVLLQVLLPLELRPYRDAFVFATVIAALVVRPNGLIVAPTARARV